MNPSQPPARGPSPGGPSAAGSSAEQGWAFALARPVDGASLAAFRIAFGALMVVQSISFAVRAEEHLLGPRLRFPFEGFEALPLWPGRGIYLHLAVCALAGLGIGLGLLFRLSCLVFALGFGYVFVLEKADYNNHYYLIILLALLLAASGAHHTWSLDRRWGRVDPAWAGYTPRRDLLLLRAQWVLVYAFAALAKLNPDWLRAEPLTHWLAADSPALVERLPWLPWLLSYGGLAFDALVGPALLWRRTRPLGLAAAALFHLSNSVLFTIGVFPWLGLAALVLFLEPDTPRRALARLAPRWAGEAGPPPAPAPRAGLALALIGAYLLLQVALPLRHWLYPGDVAWNEEGHRFSWRMKLRAKRLHRFQVTVRGPRGRVWQVDPLQHLTLRQANAMATRPDMLLHYARFLRGVFEDQGVSPARVYVHAEGSLNFCDHDHLLVDPEADLAAYEGHPLAPYPFLVPLDPPH